jgi:chaperone required for assembly of F1-ATPase
MRDIFEDIFINEPLDPMKSAQRSMRSPLRKRFYTEAAVGPAEGGAWPVLLDGKPVRTPSRNALAAPTAPLAQALADEWQAQAEHIDPVLMPLTRLANSIIDGVSVTQAQVAVEIEKYLGSDLVCYRAEQPEGLVARQSELWDPILKFGHEQLGALFLVTGTITYLDQPPGAIASAAAVIPRDIWRLGAVSTITTLTGSALLALAVSEKFLDGESAWKASQVDEDWQFEKWGPDEEALARQVRRHAEMQAAVKVLMLTA